MRRLLLLGALLVGCASPEGSTVSADEFGEDWPLTVDSGQLRCEGSSVTFTHEGTTYAVNGTARGTGRWPDIDPIWAPNPDIEGLKIDIGPLVERGLALCD